MVAPPGHGLFPRPRRVEQRPSGAAVGCEPKIRVDPQLAPQSYVLDVADGEVRVRHADDAGRRYALAALGQLRAAAVATRSAELAGVHVEDGPDVAVRGFMLDVSRDRVPTRATLDRLVGLLELARYNHLELYVEHTFAYRDHRAVWDGWSPLTVDDLAWLSERCTSAGIELVPNQNTFGHLERWLAHEPYRARAECPDGFELIPGMSRPPATLAPTSANAELALGLLAELLPNFSARTVNIGCDEPFELGLGASAADVAARGREAVYLDHVARLAGPLVADGYEVLIWADVVRHAPDAAHAALPTGVTPIAWSYEAPGFDPSIVPTGLRAVLDRLGIDLGAHTGFAANVAPLVAAGRPFWVAPGTSSWCSLVGRLDNALANLADAADAARAHGATGYLVTDWGDDGHLQPPSVSFAPLLYGGAVAWGVDANRALDPADLLDEHAFADPTRRLGAALADLGLLWAHTGQVAFNGSPLHHAAAGGLGLAIGEPDPQRLGEVVERIDAALDAIDASAPACVDAAEVRHELSVAARLARNGARRLAARAAGERPAPDVDAELAALVPEQCAAWLARARPGGLDDAVARLERVSGG